LAAVVDKNTEKSRPAGMKQLTRKSWKCTGWHWGKKEARRRASVGTGSRPGRVWRDASRPSRTDGGRMAGCLSTRPARPHPSPPTADASSNGLEFIFDDERASMGETRTSSRLHRRSIY